jgi:hypothetical protein
MFTQTGEAAQFQIVSMKNIHGSGNSGKTFKGNHITAVLPPGGYLIVNQRVDH